ERVLAQEPVSEHQPRDGVWIVVGGEQPLQVLVASLVVGPGRVRVASVPRLVAAVELPLRLADQIVRAGAPPVPPPGGPDSQQNQNGPVTRPMTIHGKLSSKRSRLFPHPQPLSPKGRGEPTLPRSPLGGEGLGVMGHESSNQAKRF